MDDMEVNPAYGHVERNEIFSNTYELPEILPPELKAKKKYSLSPREVNNRDKSKTSPLFNTFMIIFVVFTLVLILIFLIFFLVTYSFNQPLEAQRGTDIEAIKLLLNKSDEKMMIQIAKLDKAQLLIEALQEHINSSSQQSNKNTQEFQESLHDYFEKLELQLNDTDIEIKKTFQDVEQRLSNIIMLQLPDLQNHVQQLLLASGFYRKIADIDMTHPTQQCPNGFKLISRTEPPLHTCGRPDNFLECVSTIFPVNGVLYTHVCGRVVGYQIGSPSGIGSTPLSSSIDSHYVAGISLTHGQPRQHIWTFANARGEGYTSEVCPCVSGSTESVPPFVGNDYFCDSAVRGNNATDGVFYPNDPLWDGQGCGSTSTCCEFNNPPWFCKQLPQPTTDDIELRLCENSNNSADDSPFEVVEVFIK